MLSLKVLKSSYAGSVLKPYHYLSVAFTIIYFSQLKGSLVAIYEAYAYQQRSRRVECLIPIPFTHSYIYPYVLCFIFFEGIFVVSFSCNFSFQQVITRVLPHLLKMYVSFYFVHKSRDYASFLKGSGHA